ncbi:MAG: LPS export ABC transporter periplasmic protein LptC [Gammaproteobacteria bacterium]|nr:LPS export ABC transporter periplasmic protein LptC [Pseudomonadales bacterium]MCP5345529.1 LPS export ABC transporter periplasmic protein LptC [Pseudomonadales bacterium]
MQLIRFLLIPGLLAVVIFLGLDYVDRNRDSTDPETTPPPIAFNGYSEGINSVQFDAAGKIRYTLSASRQVSYLNSETALEEPVIQLYQENDSRWNIVARSGRIMANRQASEVSEDIEEIVFSGNVEVKQLDDTGNRIVLLTDTLDIDPAGEVLSTNAIVTMMGDGFEQSATGMRLNLNTEDYLFYRDVKGRYAATQN